MVDYMNITLPENINKIIKTYEKHGFSAYAVGGSIRDSLMDIAVSDWDITTSALPSETKKIFKNERIIETGINHGTVSIIQNHECIEVTTFRVDGDYLDNRHPENVSFTRNLTEDLSRRDFTVNALAFSEKDGLIDLFSGIDDINKKIIRTVGAPDKRFSEDALRIMRALRFSSTLGFTIEEETKKSIHRNKALLKNISAERINTELTKLLSGDNVFSVLQEFSDVFSVLIEELGETVGFKQYGKKHAFDVYTHICHTVDTIPKDKVLRITMLLHDIGKVPTHKLNDNGDSTFKNHAVIGGEMAEKILKRLKYDSKTVKRTAFLISHHDFEPPKTKFELKNHLKTLTPEDVKTLLIIKKSDRGALSESYRDISKESEQVLAWLKEIEENKECVNIKDLKINGDDLKQLGFKNEAIGKGLNYILNEVIAENIKNSRSYLLKYAKEELTSLL